VAATRWSATASSTGTRSAVHGMVRQGQALWQEHTDLRQRQVRAPLLAKVVDSSATASTRSSRPNIVDASQAVWDRLGITGDEVGEYAITWSDA
jgi:hypothetical protein